MSEKKMAVYMKNRYQTDQVFREQVKMRTRNRYNRKTITCGQCGKRVLRSSITHAELEDFQCRQCRPWLPLPSDNSDDENKQEKK